VLERMGRYSDLVEIVKRNRDFKNNYGILIGAYLYLRSLSAAKGRSSFWTGLILAALSGALAWLLRHSWIPVRWLE